MCGCDACGCASLAASLKSFPTLSTNLLSIINSSVAVTLSPICDPVGNAIAIRPWLILGHNVGQ
jgi:hypothetical protein